jgi:hypothetical protein
MSPLRPIRTNSRQGGRRCTSEQLKPECLDAGEHAVQRGLIRQRSRQDDALSARLSLRGGNAERIGSPR